VSTKLSPNGQFKSYKDSRIFPGDEKKARIAQQHFPVLLVRISGLEFEPVARQESLSLARVKRF
jgi:hypothetical protein